MSAKQLQDDFLLLLAADRAVQGWEWVQLTAEIQCSILLPHWREKFDQQFGTFRFLLDHAAEPVRQTFAAKIIAELN
jgi:hypothetical protein